MIIEDEIRLADILQDWFTDKGFKVTVCNDGISGYEAALKESYDVIISDIMLPGMDGFTLVKKLRDMKVFKSCNNSGIIILELQHRIAHFVEVSLYLFYLAQRVKLFNSEFQQVPF